MAIIDGADQATHTNEPVPLGQRLFDNVFLLLAAGIAIMVVVYTGWGFWELLTMQTSTLP